MSDMGKSWVEINVTDTPHNYSSAAMDHAAFRMKIERDIIEKAFGNNRLKEIPTGELVDELFRRLPELAGPLKDEIEINGLR